MSLILFSLVLFFICIISALLGDEGSMCDSSSGDLNSYQVLVNMLVHMEVLNKEEDVDKWMNEIRHFANQKYVSFYMLMIL
jgi:hypothetical protein